MKYNKTLILALSLAIIFTLAQAGPQKQGKGKGEQKNNTAVESHNHTSNENRTLANCTNGTLNETHAHNKPNSTLNHTHKDTDKPKPQQNGKRKLDDDKMLLRQLKGGDKAQKNGGSKEAKHTRNETDSNHTHNETDSNHTHNHTDGNHTHNETDSNHTHNHTEGKHGKNGTNKTHEKSGEKPKGSQPKGAKGGRKLEAQNSFIDELVFLEEPIAEAIVLNSQENIKEGIVSSQLRLLLGGQRLTHEFNQNQ
ncbi:UNKNOWN [Stylonychia lemnae]|uniref:Uncharacterized protein n=1 Tax=Stylonychia lemnae TaxID=5949 RepID=A0A078B154_STYLE|nr:UNKNOWN [Stylonychia lemnae]|eukprot:CDW86838.1 UNKNOWN [Stylonychia lemnae]